MVRPRSIQDLLAESQAGVDRVSPADLAGELAAGALVVDIRPVEQRQRDGTLPGAIVIDRNVLEWRLDPASPDRIDAVTGHEQRIVIVCNEGFSSSLAAATLRTLGLHRATDLVGGFQAWSAMSHWNAVYTEKPTETLSWHQEEPDTSLRLLTAAAPPPASVIDVGAGASVLASRLLAAGWSDVTVLDVSAEALADGPAGVNAVVADVLTWRPRRTYDVWHDRAVFHFLTTSAKQAKYIDVAQSALRSGGVLVVATFAPDGPTECSGLPTARYGADDLAAAFGDGFTVEHSEREEHVTPWGSVQPFTWLVLRRGRSN